MSHPQAQPPPGPDADPEAVARDICLRQLTAGPRSRAQLEEVLRRRDVPPETGESVLDRLAEVGLVDDATFARAWVDSRHAGRGLARRALSHELRARGISDDIVENAVAPIDFDQEEATARRLLARRLPATAGLPEEVRVRRLTGLLARKGYPPGMAQKIIRESLAEERADAAAPPTDGGAGIGRPRAMEGNTVGM